MLNIETYVNRIYLMLLNLLLYDVEICVDMVNVLFNRNVYSITLCVCVCVNCYQP